MVLSRSTPSWSSGKDQIKNWDAGRAYHDEAAHKSDFERSELNKDKTGVRLEGVEAINPASGKQVPMFVSDYVLMGYGTGAVMGVPGHDQRDWEFATKFGLPIIEVVKGGDITKEAFTLKDDTGIMVNSGFLNGMTVKEAIPAMKKWVTEQGLGHPKTNFKLRDWVFSRQRYWGEPIPLVNCPKCGWVPLPEDQLPLLLPEVDSYEVTDTGEISPGQDDRLGQHHLPQVRRPCPARDGYHAPVGRFQLVLPALYGPPQRQGPGQQGGPGLLVSRGLVQRRHGAHHAAPALQPLLAQVPL